MSDKDEVAEQLDGEKEEATISDDSSSGDDDGSDTEVGANSSDEDEDEDEGEDEEEKNNDDDGNDDGNDTRTTSLLGNVDTESSNTNDNRGRKNTILGRMFARKKKTVQENNQIDLLDNRWMFAMEMESSCCLLCGNRFPVNSRYNCRLCCLAVCGDCSSRRLQTNKSLRLCSTCYDLNHDKSNVELTLRPAPYPVMDGQMTKCGDNRKNWKLRSWFLDSNGLLSYFADDFTKPKGTLNTCILERCVPCGDESLSSVSWKKNVADDTKFALIFPRRNLFLHTNSRIECEKWRSAVCLFAKACITCGYALFQSDNLAGNVMRGRSRSKRSSTMSASDDCANPLSTSCTGTGEDGGADETVDGNSVYVVWSNGTACHAKCLSCVVCHEPLSADKSAPNTAYSERNVILCKKHAEQFIHDDVHAKSDLRKEDADIEIEDRLQSLQPETLKKVEVDDYNERRTYIIRKQAAQVANVCIARKQELLEEKKAAVMKEKIDDKEVIGQEAGVAVTPHIVTCAILGIGESLRGTQEMIEENRLDSCDDKVKYATGLPNGQRYDLIDHHPKKFNELRNILNISLEEFIESFESIPDVRDKISGGRSGSLVLPTSDQKFIVKSIPKVERDSLLKILDSYVAYIKDNPNSLLVKFVGLYEIKTSSNPYQPFVVMKNVLRTDLKLQEIYDLKGSLVGRSAVNTLKNKDDPLDYCGVRKDNDLRRTFRVGARGKAILKNQLKADAFFLNKHGLMDYSLLVGVHNCERDGSCCVERKPKEIKATYEDGSPKLREDDITKYGVRGKGPEDSVDFETESVYYFGIIDILQPWTSKKKAENLAKSMYADKDAISAVNSDDYTDRFIEFGVARLSSE